MADTVFLGTTPPLKVHDNGDGTYSLVVAVQHPAAGVDTVFGRIFPDLKAVDLGDGTYAASIVRQA